MGAWEDALDAVNDSQTEWDLYYAAEDGEEALKKYGRSSVSFTLSISTFYLGCGALMIVMGVKMQRVKELSVLGNVGLVVGGFLTISSIIMIAVSAYLLLEIDSVDLVQPPDGTPPS